MRDPSHPNDHGHEQENQTVPSLRYLLLPKPPVGSEKLSEEQLFALVTRDAIIGVAKVLPAGEGDRA